MQRSWQLNTHDQSKVVKYHFWAEVLSLTRILFQVLFGENRN